MRILSRVKDWFTTTFGVVGPILIWLILFAYYFSPLYFLPLPWWANTLIILLLLNVGELATLLSIPLWIWAFVRVISAPLDTASYVFLVLFAINVLILIHDIVVPIIMTIKEKRQYELFPAKKKPLHPFFKVILWLLSVAIAAYGIVYFTGGTLPTINIPAIFSTPTPTATPAPTSTPKPTSKPTATPKAQYLPVSGKYYGHSMSANLDYNRTSEITITTPSDGAYYCIILVEAKNPSSKICSIFMRSGKTTTVKVPAEKALVYYTTAPVGSLWYGPKDYFGTQGSWSTSDDVFDFSEYTWSITLQQVTNGNWDTDPVNAKNVPFLD